MQLRPHQEKALQAMADNDLGQVIVPTGGGKTMCMIYDVLRELQRLRVLLSRLLTWLMVLKKL